MSKIKILENMIKRIVKEELSGIQIGKTYELDLEGYGPAMFNMDDDEFDILRRYHGKPVKVIKQSPADDADGEENFYDIETEDGKTFYEISDWHLKPIGWNAGK